MRYLSTSATNHRDTSVITMLQEQCWCYKPVHVPVAWRFGYDSREERVLLVILSIHSCNKMKDTNNSGGSCQNTQTVVKSLTDDTWSNRKWVIIRGLREGELSAFESAQSVAVVVVSFHQKCRLNNNINTTLIGLKFTTNDIPFSHKQTLLPLLAAGDRFGWGSLWSTLQYWASHTASSLERTPYKNQTELHLNLKKTSRLLRILFESFCCFTLNRRPQIPAR